MDITRLDNREKTGFLPALLKTEGDIFALSAEFMKTQHAAAELAAFQEQMAEKALAALSAAH